MTNEQAMAAIEGAFKSFNIVKAEGTIDVTNTNFGGIIPRPKVEAMINLMKKEDSLLDICSVYTRDNQAGQVPYLDFAQQVMRPSRSNDPMVKTTRPDTGYVPYACKKFTAEWQITFEELREAAHAGIDGFEQQVQAAFSAALANNVSDVVLNGDTTTTILTERDANLAQVDGFLKRTASSNVYDALGKAFGLGTFAFAKDRMPYRYTADPGNAFISSARIENLWRVKLSGVQQATTTRSGLGDQVLTSTVVPTPEGKPLRVLPQMSDQSGPSGTPDAVSDGTTYLTIRVNALLPDATDSTGRKVRVYLKSTGAEEICTVSRSTSTNVIVTAGVLGQTTNSTTTTDYVIQIADETNLIYGNPKGLIVVMCSGMRSYRIFNPKAERWEITTHLELDTCVPIPAQFVRIKRLGAPAIETWV